MHGYREVDMEKKGRKELSDMFAGFGNPNFSVCVKLNVSKVVETSRKTNTSVFANTMYLISLALNEIEEFRYRYLKEKIVCFDSINPGWTVMTNLGVYKNCNMEMTENYQKFYENAKRITELTKTNIDGEYNKTVPDGNDVFYYSCNPWIDFLSVSNPLPLGNMEQLSIPRIIWGKFNEKFEMPLDICACHALIDGAEVSKGFENIQKKFDSAESLLAPSPGCP